MKALEALAVLAAQVVLELVAQQVVLLALLVAQVQYECLYIIETL